MVGNFRKPDVLADEKMSGHVSSSRPDPSQPVGEARREGDWMQGYAAQCDRGRWTGEGEHTAQRKRWPTAAVQWSARAKTMPYPVSKKRQYAAHDKKLSCMTFFYSAECPLSKKTKVFGKNDR